MEGGKNYYCYNGATPLISSMMNVKYMLSDNDKGENMLRTLVGQSGNYYLYENKYCLPMGFMMSEEAIETWDLDLGNKINQINSLATALGAEDYMMVRISNPTMEVTPGKTTFTLKSDGYFALFFAKISSIISFTSLFTCKKLAYRIRSLASRDLNV